jgi:hypothetical protein
MILDLFMLGLKLYDECANWLESMPHHSESNSVSKPSGYARVVPAPLPSLSPNTRNEHCPAPYPRPNTRASDMNLYGKDNSKYINVRLEREQDVIYTQVTEVGSEFTGPDFTQIYTLAKGVGNVRKDAYDAMLTGDVGCIVRFGGFEFRMFNLSPKKP